MVPAEQFDSSLLVRSGLVKNISFIQVEGPYPTKAFGTTMIVVQSLIKAFFAHFGVDLLRQNVSENGSNFFLVFHGNRETERSVLIPIMITKIEKKFRKIARFFEVTILKSEPAPYISLL